jgi:hypothetical protein
MQAAAATNDTRELLPDGNPCFSVFIRVLLFLPAKAGMPLRPGVGRINQE